jgi:hypothetical protein
VRPSLRSCALVALFALWGSGACAGRSMVAPAPGPALTSAVGKTGALRVFGPFTATALALPMSDPPPLNHAVASVGLVVVPMGGGAAIAGLHGWYVDPAPEPIVSVAFSPGDAFWFSQVTTSGRFIIRKRTPQGALTNLGELPRGAYHIASDGESTGWAWGREAAGFWDIWRLREGAAAVRLVQTAERVSALAPVGPTAFVAAIGDTIFLFKAGEAARALSRLAEPVEGLAVSGAEGTLFVATHAGLYESRRAGTISPVAVGAFGPLVARGDRVYMLSRSEGLVYVLRRQP